MKTAVESLLVDIETARHHVISAVKGLSDRQANFKPSSEEWSIAQIIEHLVWAEEGGICGMFKAINGIKSGQLIWEGVSPNHGLSIEQIVENTWQPKEKVPEVAAPRLGGPIQYWITRLENCETLLNSLSQYFYDVDLETAIYPHPISGPLNIFQRLEFLRFHMDRHLDQIKRVKENPDFP